MFIAYLRDRTSLATTHVLSALATMSAPDSVSVVPQDVVEVEFGSEETAPKPAGDAKTFTYQECY